MPPQIRFQVVQAVGLDLMVQLLVELGLGHVEGAYLVKAGSLQVSVPVESLE